MPSLYLQKQKAKVKKQTIKEILYCIITTIALWNVMYWSMYLAL